MGRFSFSFWGWDLDTNTKTSLVGKYEIDKIAWTNFMCGSSMEIVADRANHTYDMKTNYTWGMTWGNGERSRATFCGEQDKTRYHIFACPFIF